jgi:O-succinylbenzoic acid--CoA ligase
VGEFAPAITITAMPAADERPLIATLLPNRALAPVVRAAWERGDAVLPLNPALGPAETERLLAFARPTHLHDADGVHTRTDGIPVTDDIAAVVCTSGTTGTPKAVELTYAGMQAMGAGVSRAIDAGAADRWLACHPLFFVAGLAILGRAWVTGVPVVVHDAFDIDAVGASPMSEGATIVSVVPTTLRRLVRAGTIGQFRAVVVGGAPLPDPLRAEAEATGVAVFDSYGLTETWGGCVTNGRPNDEVELRLLEADEVAIRGTPVMRGYRFAPEITDAALSADGWFRTGDVGSFANGRLAIVDRIKDLVISGGVNVSPSEVEGILALHPGIADVCVIGVPDEEWGERVVACVVPRDANAVPELSELRAMVRDHLGAAKAPKELRVLDAIPRSPSGKPLRRELRS